MGFKPTDTIFKSNDSWGLNRRSLALNGEADQRQVSLFLFSGTPVNDNQQGQHHHENNGRKRTQFRSQPSFAGIGIDIGGKCLKTFVTDRKYRYCKIIDRKCQRKHETANHSRTNLRNNHFAECLHRSRSQIEGGFVNIRIHLLETGQHAEYHIRSTESDVCQYNGRISLRYPQRHKQQKQ